MQTPETPAQPLQYDDPLSQPVLLIHFVQLVAVYQVHKSEALCGVVRGSTVAVRFTTWLGGDDAGLYRGHGRDERGHDDGEAAESVGA